MGHGRGWAFLAGVVFGVTVGVLARLPAGCQTTSVSSEILMTRQATRVAETRTHAHEGFRQAHRHLQAVTFLRLMQESWQADSAKPLPVPLVEQDELYRAYEQTLTMAKTPSERQQVLGLRYRITKEPLKWRLPSQTDTLTPE